MNGPRVLSVQQNGFTLVEILVVLAVSGVIIAGMVNFMIAQGRSYSLQEDLQEMGQNARAALEVITGRLRDAIDIETTGNGIDEEIKIITDLKDYSYILRGLKGVSEDTTDDRVSYRIGSGNQNIAYFITQDLDGDGEPEVPLFQYDDLNNPRVVTVTIIARTRHRDPGYIRNGSLINRGYRQVVFIRRVILRSM
jgi:prepilin-type N-terminal cleavage/methylation domain-containing protein